MKPNLHFLSLLFVLIFWHQASAQSPNNRFLFIADMTGDQETPPVATSARGVASILVSDDGASLTIHGVFSGLSGPVTGCHFHTGVEGSSGPVSTNFSGNVDGNSLHATIAMPVNFLAKALRKEIYLNVHTGSNPAGEIRGQLVLMTDLQYAGILTGAEEVPPVSTTASGLFRLTYFPGSLSAHYIASYNGLSGLATAAHIHSAAFGVSGPVVVPFTAGLPNTFVGDLTISALPADFVQKLEDQLLYVNVHTAANPAGEIRGQLHSLGAVTFETVLNGDQETPPVSTSAIGTALASLAPTLDTLTYYVSASGLTPTAAHFHLAAAGTAGPVILPLASTTMPNFYTGSAVLTSAQVASLLKGDVYVNVHTAANPAGEIRGQMEPNLRRVYAFDLCGAQEVPANNSQATGAAVVTVDHLNTNLSYLYVVNGLSGAATAAHIHTGAFGVSGPVLKPLNLPAPRASGVIAITGNDAIQLEADNTYLNVHTAAFASGEIRGQIRRALSCAENVGINDPVLSEISLYPNPSSGLIELRLDIHKGFEGMLLLSDLTGKTLQNKTLLFAEGEQLISLDLGDFAPGLYLAQIKSAEFGVIRTFKIIRE